MKVRRWLLVGLIAVVAALGVFGPSSASASVWKDKGVNVTKFFELGLTGGYTLGIGAGGIQCDLFASLNSSGGSVAKIIKFDTKNCTGLGSLAKCFVATSEAKSLPWSVSLGAADLTISNLRMRHTFKAGCSIAESDITFSSVTMTPDGTTGINEFSLFGSKPGAEMAAEVLVDFPNRGTYGIG